MSVRAASGSANLKLLFPVELPGATISRITLDLDRKRRVLTDGSPVPDTMLIATISGLSEPLLRELSDTDYGRILVKIVELLTGHTAAGKAA